MIEEFDKTYEVCNCHKITLESLISQIREKELKSLGELQEVTRAGTDCRYCLFKEGDLGKMKKEIYCKDILKEVLNG